MLSGRPSRSIVCSLALALPLVAVLSCLSRCVLGDDRSRGQGHGRPGF